MSDPATELAQARIRYLSAFVRGETLKKDLDRKLLMISRAEKRLELAEERLIMRRAANRKWHQRRKLENALLRSLSQQEDHAP